ncbi:MAG: tRNA uracil 4-sulfurtransferase ThiI [Bacillota bacterium]
MFDAILIRFGEIGLKGDNRGFFESTLINNMRKALEGTDSEVIRSSGRIMVKTRGEHARILTRLQKVFGIVSMSQVKIVEPEMESIYRSAQEILDDCDPKPSTFKAESRRADKKFPYTSPEISGKVGAYLLEVNPELRVDVHQPEVTINIEVRDKQAYVFKDASAGPGGLPVGVCGRGLLLLSGGIDSPVAGWMAMKRGIKLSVVHFHSFPYTSERSRLKVIDLAKVLSEFNQGLNLSIVNMAEIQETIKERCPERFRVTLLRRLMLRISERIARRSHIQTLITGESVGQVASQTLESMTVIGDAIRMLVLRPLAGMDKIEISERAKNIGTYNISILPYDDCCSLFLPRHPVTKPQLNRVQEAEAVVDWEPLLDKAVNNLEIVEL